MLLNFEWGQYNGRSVGQLRERKWSAGDPVTSTYEVRKKKNLVFQASMHYLPSRFFIPLVPCVMPLKMLMLKYPQD